MKKKPDNNMNSKFLVEVLYNQVYTKTDENDMKSYDTRITTQVYSFEGSNKSSTQYDAQKFMDNVIRHGLELKGGSVLKSIIHPSSILQIGLVDELLYQKELELGLKDISVDTPAEMPVGTAESTPVDL